MGLTVHTIPLPVPGMVAQGPRRQHAVHPIGPASPASAEAERRARKAPLNCPLKRSFFQISVFGRVADSSTPSFASISIVGRTVNFPEQAACQQTLVIILLRHQICRADSCGSKVNFRIARQAKSRVHHSLQGLLAIGSI